MTPFEIIILFIYWQFAASCTYKNLCDDTDTIADQIVIMLSSITIGVFWFPAIFADKIWDKLNK